MTDRIAKIRQILKENSMDAVIISTPANITHLTGFEFLINEDREAFVVVTKKSQYIISSQLYKSELVHFAPDFAFLEISSATKKTFFQHVADVYEKESLASIGFEEDNITFQEYQNLLQKDLQLKPIRLDALRSQKDADEILSIEKACALGDKALTYIFKHIQEGISEKQLAFLLETYIRENGADISFPTIIAFGKNAAVPHHQTNETKLKKNQFVLMDFGVKLGHYCSDMTRTVFFGKPTSQQKKVYQAVYDAQKKALSFLESNKLPISALRTDKLARNHITGLGYPEFPHSLGHSIGITVHDGFRLSPLSTTMLKEGYVFSIEPGIYIPNKVGIRIEDIVAIEASGPRLLTSSARELIVL